MRRAELKPCPFCGGLAEIVVVTRHIENNLIVARCTQCKASTKTFSEHNPIYAYAAWNCRVSEGQEEAQP